MQTMKNWLETKHRGCIHCLWKEIHSQQRIRH